MEGREGWGFEINSQNINFQETGRLSNITPRVQEEALMASDDCQHSAGWMGVGKDWRRENQ